MPSVVSDPTPAVISEQDEHLSVRDKFVAAVLQWDADQELVRFKRDGAGQPQSEEVSEQHKLAKIIKKYVGMHVCFDD